MKGGIWGNANLRLLSASANYNNSYGLGQISLNTSTSSPLNTNGNISEQRLSNGSLRLTNQADALNGFYQVTQLNYRVKIFTRYGEKNRRPWWMRLLFFLKN